MKLDTLLAEKSSAIIKRWLDRVLKTYPADTQVFFRKQKDRFANPVGQTLAREMEGLFAQLLEGADRDKVSPFLDRIIRIRAVQDFSPSEALAFIFQLKDIVREELGGALAQNGLAEELRRFESRIDELAQVAFDLYGACREKIYQVRLNEERRRVHMLLRRAGMAPEESSSDPDQRTGE